MADRRSRAPRPAAPSGLRIGLGVDVHPFAEGRPLVLGGVTIPGPRGLLGHSDADVLAHAACDSYLGALGLPDLGTRFPASDARNAGRASGVFLRDIAREARARGYALVNLDAVLLAEAPLLQPHLAAVRRGLARALDCPEDRVSVKVKRSEGLGAIGRGEGIAAHVVVLLGPAAPARPTPRGRRR